MSSESVSIFYSGENGSGGNSYSGSYATTLQAPYFAFSLEPGKAPDSKGGQLPLKNTDSLKAATPDKVTSGIVTNISISKAEIVSVAPTIGKDIYMYVGGESAWEIYLTGIALRTCEGGYEGFGTMLNWYTEQNVAKTGKACTLTLAGGGHFGAVFKAYLQAFRIQSIKDINAFQFNFKFYAIKQ